MALEPLLGWINKLEPGTSTILLAQEAGVVMLCSSPVAEACCRVTQQGTLKATDRCYAAWALLEYGEAERN